MNTEDYIANYQKRKRIDRIQYIPVVKCYRVAGEPLVECQDAVIKNGRYAGIRLSDIFIFDPNFLHYLTKSQYVDSALKDIAKAIQRHQSSGMDAISAKIALGKK